MFEIKIQVDETVDMVTFFNSLNPDAIVKSWEPVNLVEGEMQVVLWFLDLNSAKRFCRYWFDDESAIRHIDGPEDQSL